LAICGTNRGSSRWFGVKAIVAHLRAQAARYERLAQRRDAGGDGAFLRAMADGYRALADRCLTGAVPHPHQTADTAVRPYTPSIRETLESLSNNNAIRA
jgi:hypothetical protein